LKPVPAAKMLYKPREAEMRILVLKNVMILFIAVFRLTSCALSLFLPMFKVCYR